MKNSAHSDQGTVEWNVLEVHDGCLSPTLRSEVHAFLDIASWTHPIQYPAFDEEDVAGVHTIVRRNGRIVFYAKVHLVPLLGRRVPLWKEAIVFKGPAWLDRDSLSVGLLELANEGRRRNWTRLTLDPQWESKESQVWCEGLQRAGWRVHNDVSVSHTLRLQLALDPDRLRGQMKKSHQYQVRRALREGIEVVGARSLEEIESYRTIQYEMCMEKGLPPAPPGTFQHLFQWFAEEPGRGVFLLAKLGEAILGGIVVIRSGDRGFYVYGASARRTACLHGDVTAGYPMQWQGILWARERGCTSYDFGGFDPDAKDSGPGRMKLGFGGEVVAFGPRLQLVLKPGFVKAASVLRRWTKRT